MGILAWFLREEKKASSVEKDSFLTPSDLLELTRRIKVIERELEDLHAAYRRLRGSVGGLNKTPALLETKHEHIQPLDKRSELRARAKQLMGKNGSAQAFKEN